MIEGTTVEEDSPDYVPPVNDLEVQSVVAQVNAACAVCAQHLKVLGYTLTYTITKD